MNFINYEIVFIFITMRMWWDDETTQLVGEIGMVLRSVRKIHPIQSIPATHFNLCDTFCPGGCDLRTLLTTQGTYRRSITTLNKVWQRGRYSGDHAPLEYIALHSIVLQCTVYTQVSNGTIDDTRKFF